MAVGANRTKGATRAAGVPVSNKISEGGYQNFIEIPRGEGIHFSRTQKNKQNKAKYPFRAIPPSPQQKDHPPPLRNSEQSLIARLIVLHNQV